MKIYTKTGDTGETGLYGGGRVRKDVPRIEACGTIDELNSLLGVVRAEPLGPNVDSLLARIQNELFDIGAELATRDPAAQGVPRVSASHIAALEAAIDPLDESLPPLKQFILPGGTRGAALAHLARSVCRRAERRVVTLMAEPDAKVSHEVLVYLNRLSDLLFVLARAMNHASGLGDVIWRQP
jgi:cob(I)alamin adenosyltransferase